MNLFLVFLFSSMLFCGCLGNSQQSGNENTGAKTKMIISPVTIISEKETILAGGNVSANRNRTNDTLINQTVPNYKFEPNKTLFIFFINATYSESQLSTTTGNERHGEAILLKKGDADILIDTGTVQSSIELVNFLKQKGVDDIELLVLTHPRPENYGAANLILDNFEVEQVMWNGDSFGDKDYEMILDKAKNKSRKVFVTSYLMQLDINGINLLVLNPRNHSERSFAIDDDGIVLKIIDRNFCLMTMSDTGYWARMKILISEEIDPKCTVLHIPNYGFGVGISNVHLFLSKVTPKSAIITGSYYTDQYRNRVAMHKILAENNIPYYETFIINKTSASTRILRITIDGYNYSISS